MNSSVDIIVQIISKKPRTIPCTILTAILISLPSQSYCPYIGTNKFLIQMLAPKYSSPSLILSKKRSSARLAPRVYHQIGAVRNGNTISFQTAEITICPIIVFNQPTQLLPARARPRRYQDLWWRPYQRRLYPLACYHHALGR